MHISADGADLHRVENRAFFKGDVEIINGDLSIKADAAEYDRTTGIFDAQGNVFLQQPTLRMTSTQLTYDTQNEKGSATDVKYRLLDRAARGNASTATVTGSDLSDYTQVSYTTCKPGNEDWILNATEMELDKGTGVGQAKNVSVSFKGVPFFYTPYISFPIDDRRKSGVLIPSIGTSENTGVDISVPYYFNIAPHMDATITPRIMSKRGLMLGGEFRYLAKNFDGEIRAEVLPSDKERTAGESKDRGALSLQASGTPASRWRYDFDINHISDDDYLEDFGSSLAAVSSRHQERRGDIRYQGEGWNFLGRVQNYQTIDKTIAAVDQPYERLPQLLATLNRPDQAYGLTYHLKTEYVSFGHTSDTKVAGDRITIRPGISLPLRRAWGFITPKISIDHTAYNLDNQTVGLSSSPNRTLPTLSMDGGLIFERDTNLFDTALTQTLEPRLYYLYTPKEDQSELPEFDTTEYDFSFANLFRENRFNGTDKIGDANQLTTALTTRFLEAGSGKELAQASIGQIFYFRDREIQLQSASSTKETDDSSSLAAAISANLGDNWRTNVGIQWNPHKDSDATEKSSAGLHYKDSSNRIVNATYRLTNSSIEQTDISARWPFTHSLTAVGRWNYSLLHNETMEAFAGVEYSNCCWTTRFVARDYRSSIDDTSNLAFLIQLELKGLTSIGSKVDKFLEDGILGYPAN
ncbi:MAG: LPS-assembly protein LptD [Gammaproteobacteria bacterium]|nr:LPS-assembly protein LptD [Gammaproteobacteria bacterium]